MMRIDILTLFPGLFPVVDDGAALTSLAVRRFHKDREVQNGCNIRVHVRAKIFTTK